MRDDRFEAGSRTRQMERLARFPIEIENGAIPTEGPANIREAVATLIREANVRTPMEVLARVCGREVDMESKADRRAFKNEIVQLLMTVKPDDNEQNVDRNEQNVDRKVRNWLNGSSAASREAVLQLAYALKLDLAGTNELLMRLCGAGLHWRSPKDIVYIFAILRNLSYTETEQLMGRMQAAGLLDTPDAPELEKFPEDQLTAQVRGEVRLLTNEDELVRFLTDSRDRLGARRNTAYQIFRDKLRQIGWERPKKGETMRINNERKAAGLPVLKKKYEKKEKDDLDPGDKPMTNRDVLCEILHTELMRGIELKKRRRKVQSPEQKAAEGVSAEHAALQRLIGRRWPEETRMSKIINRKEEVPRNMLIMLFMAADETDLGDDDAYIPETLEEIYEDRLDRLGNMLNDCGFAPLDARDPFDWMMMYCLCVEDSFETDGRIQRFLTDIFQRPMPEICLEGFFADDEERPVSDGDRDWN